MSQRRLSPIHPGEVLQEEFLEPLSLTQYALAKNISVAPKRISEIVRCRRAISADTALRLARFFGTTAEFWMNLQARYELERAEDDLGDRIDREVSPHAA